MPNAALPRRSLFRASGAGLMLAGLARAGGASAATPRDTLVVGQQLDQLISLDPAEAFEVGAGEFLSNCYQRLVAPDPADPNRLVGELAASWTVDPASRAVTFRLRPGRLFSSGRPVTDADAAFSLQRAIRLNRTPAFILAQFGFTRDNVEERITASAEDTLVLRPAEALAPSLLLYCLTTNVASVLDRAGVLEHDAGGDLGNAWRKTNSAGSGSFVLGAWKASELVSLQANPHAAVPPRLRRVLARHVPDPGVQFLLLRKGDIDIARDLQNEQLRSAATDPALRLSLATRDTLTYVAMNLRHPALARPGVRQAIKWAIDYEGIHANIAPLTRRVQQSFLPQGFPGAIPDQPFRRDPARARSLLAGAGFAEGFEVTLDHASLQPNADIAQGLQANLAEIGIRVRLIAGETRQLFTRTRARQHELALLTWGADYFDPHTNAEAFTINPDNGDSATKRTIAWRCSWQDAELSARAEAAARETDAAARIAAYAALQRDSHERSPFAFLLQTTEVAALRREVIEFDLVSLPGRTVYAPAARG
jgi:peptide/nickel transport system substrate-binding protein